MSYQREDERYWTDYLRVALPIVGLLLLVGLLWFWLASIIGDDDNDEPTPTPETALLVTAPASTATATTQVVINPTTGPAPTNTPGGEAQPTNTPEQGGGEPTEEPSGNGYADGDIVITNSDDVRFRSEASAESDDTIIDAYPAGTEFTINGEAVEDEEGNLWWPVIGPDGETEGYITDEFIELSE